MTLGGRCGCGREYVRQTIRNVANFIVGMMAVRELPAHRCRLACEV